MTDRAYIVSRTLENKIAIAENNDQNTLIVTLDVLKTILDLLKEQETVKPRRIDGKRNHFIKCGNCNYDLVTGFQFCPHCGKKVKWND